MNITGYTIENQIGQGGMAIVYRAIQNSLRRPVALKVMNPLLANSSEFSERFLNEGRLLASLQHNHIMTIYDIGICDGLHYISMELVDGGDLKQRIASGIAPQTALDYVMAIGSCLQSAHTASIVHRDVKPVNILFRRDGTLLLTDFGIAKQLVNPERLTATGNLMGTPYYLSPEQALGSPLDGRADIYSLGVVFYEMLVRKKPFEGRSEFDIVLKQVEEPLPRLPQNLAHFQPLLDKMTAKQPDERFSDAASLLHAAQHLRETGRWDGGNIILPVSDIASEPQAINPVRRQEGDEGDAPASAQTVVNQAPASMEEQTVHLDKQRQTPDASSHTTPKRRKIGKLVTTVGVLGAATVIGVLAFTFVIVTIALPGPGEQQRSTPSPDSQQMASDQQAAPDNQVELARQAAWARRAEVARQAALEKQAELARQAEVKKQAELQRQSEVARQAALEKQAALERQAELDRQAEAEKQRALARQSEIDALLASAADALSDYRLTVPEHHSAYHYYQKVLALDPQNRQAKSGFAHIADRYYWLAKKNFDDGKDKTARRYVDTGLQVKPDHPNLLALRNKLDRQAGTVGGSVDNLFRRVKGIFK